MYLQLFTHSEVKYTKNQVHLRCFHYISYLELENLITLGFSLLYFSIMLNNNEEDRVDCIDAEICFSIACKCFQGYVFSCLSFFEYLNYFGERLNLIYLNSTDFYLSISVITRDLGTRSFHHSTLTIPHHSASSKHPLYLRNLFNSLLLSPMPHVGLTPDLF